MKMAQEFNTPYVSPEPPKKSNTPLIIGIIVAVLLCCCCLILLGGWFFGDAILQALEEMALLPATFPIAAL
jgi:hypothetical protein